MSEPMMWQPIATVPEGEHVLLWFQRGERGVGGMECASVYKEDTPCGFCFWTHGGPNSGSDWASCDGETPTHWMPLPLPPNAQVKPASCRTETNDE